MIINKEGNEASGSFELQTVAIYNNALSNDEIKRAIRLLNSKNSKDISTQSNIKSPFAEMDLDIGFDINETSDFGIGSNKCIKLSEKNVINHVIIKNVTKVVLKNSRM